MEIREKLKKYYQIHGVKIGKEYIENIISNTERTEAIMKLYKQEEVESMNYIFGKPKNNAYFTEFELEISSKINLFDREVVKWCKLIWENKDNEENLNKILNALNEGKCSKCGE